MESCDSASLFEAASTLDDNKGILHRRKGEDIKRRSGYWRRRLLYFMYLA